MYFGDRVASCAAGELLRSAAEGEVEERAGVRRIDATY
jgi:hypothetical protein